MRLGRAACLLAVAAAVGTQGCGGGGNSDEEKITAVVNELFAVQESGDAGKACDEVYVVAEPDKPAGEGSAEPEGTDPEAEGEAGEGADSGPCETAFESAEQARQAAVKDLSTRLASVEVDGDTATAVVHTELERSDGSHLSQDVPYDLVRTADGWRIRISEEG